MKERDAHEGRYNTQKELYLGVGKISSQNSRKIHMCVSKAQELFKHKLQDMSEEVCMEREREQRQNGTSTTGLLTARELGDREEIVTETGKRMPAIQKESKKI